MNCLPLPIEELTRRVVAGEPFALVRYGDGEFACLAGQHGENCDGVRYSPEMATALAASLHNPALTHCLASIARHKGADDWIARHAPDVVWHESDQVLRASEAGTLWPFRVAVFHRHMLYVGPERLREVVREGLGADALVAVPLSTAFDVLDGLCRETSKQIEAKHYRLVGVSAGPAAKILIDRLARRHPGVSFIDFGSVWDMYAGTPTRSGAKRMTPEQVAGLAWKNFHWQWPTRIASRRGR